MNQKCWSEIDRAAAREGKALRRARRYMSRNGRSRPGKMSETQGLFDELLSLHYTHCSFCGVEFKLGPTEGVHPKTRHGERISVFLKDLDVCDECRPLSERLIRSAPARKRE